MSWAWKPLKSYIHKTLVRGASQSEEKPGSYAAMMNSSAAMNQIRSKIWNMLDPVDQQALQEALNFNPNDNNNAEEVQQIGQRVVWLWHGMRDDYSRLPADSYPGIIRWMGQLSGFSYAGVEFDQRLGLSSGYVDDVQIFKCKSGYGGFILPICLIPEIDMDIQLPDEQANVTVERALDETDLHRIGDGTDRPYGIQGQMNSCYMDTSIFSMFAFSSVFDWMLTGTPWNDKPDLDTTAAEKTQRVLREIVVNPLRRNIYNSDTNMLKLRKILSELNPKFWADQMDPQEFMESLFREVFHLDGFISLSSGEVDFLNQLLCQENEEHVPTVQELFDESVGFQDLKFKNVPTPAFILQMPRSGQHFKMFKGILPTLTLDISKVLDGPEKVTMDLFAVICIETNHFVTFVKTGKERLAPWVLFNSMAKREEQPSRGEYFVPMVFALPEMGEWLDKLEKEPKFLENCHTEPIPDEVQHILADPYICFYAPSTNS